MTHGPTRAGLKTPMLRRYAPLVAAAALLVACAGDDAQTVRTATPANTVGGVGRLPVTIPEVTFPEGVAEGFVLPALQGAPVGVEVNGNRVLLIGDSIFASLSRRQGGAACDRLVPLGWQVAVEAEPGRFAEFGERVARARSGEGWDTVVVFMGSNYDGNRPRYQNSMTSIIERFADVPVVLVTTSLFRAWQNDVNDVIRDLAEQYDRVRLIDWETISTNRALLTRDRIHLSADGQVVLAAAVAQMLGEAPIGEGRCLPSQFTDDSLITGSTTPNSTSSATSGSTSTSTSTSTSLPGDEAPDDEAPDDEAPDDEAPSDEAPDDESAQEPTDTSSPTTTEAAVATSDASTRDASDAPATEGDS